MQPYRLEMGSELSLQNSKDLYDFWGSVITKKIRQELNDSGSNVLVNLASAEYFKCIDIKKLKAIIITSEFREEKSGELKTIVVFTKRARGLMSRFIIENKIIDPSDLQAFDLEGYHFNSRLSSSEKPVFTRISA